MVKSLVIAGCGGFLGTVARFAMIHPSEACILRIFIGSTDRYNQQPLYEYLVFQAKKHGLAGATAIKGVMSFGASSIIHSYKFREVSDKVPVDIEMVDEEPKVLAFFESARSILESMRYGCLVTLDKTHMLIYKSGQKKILEL